MEEKDRREEPEKLSRSEEEKIERTLRDITEDIEVPESLKPEAVEQMLAGKGHSGKKRIRWRYAAGAAAACICFAAGLAAVYGVFYPEKAGGGQSGLEATAETGEALQQDEGEDLTGLAGAGIMMKYTAISELIRRCSNGIPKIQERFWRIRLAPVRRDPRWLRRRKVPGDYSDTNVREEGVGEGDIVKTDGKYLYVMNQRKISIVGIGSDKMEKTAEIIPDGEGNFSELYVEGDLLAAVYIPQSYAIAEDSAGQNGTEGDGNSVSVFVYDISDPSDPRQTGTFTQSGYYNTMRIRDGYVYLISNFYAGMPAEPTDRTVYIPQVQGKLVEPGDIYIPGRSVGKRVYTDFGIFAG